ncbi:unnamed protein product [Strongylus vulgaris]|uniref:Uncharacterized protein n=1 Tax=Strongylus vulgaris TaxID=40348 RepID=A0A3P7IHC0_STRVU|nr:unnamed protein product [Strongylus vulgaris]
MRCYREKALFEFSSTDSDGSERLFADQSPVLECVSLLVQGDKVIRGPDAYLETRQSPTDGILCPIGGPTAYPGMRQLTTSK